jgi:hypothetical protein
MAKVGGTPPYLLKAGLPAYYLVELTFSPP